jgi:hypothetical protein
LSKYKEGILRGVSAQPNSRSIETHPKKGNPKEYWAGAPSPNNSLYIHHQSNPTTTISTNPMQILSKQQEYSQFLPNPYEYMPIPAKIRRICQSTTKSLQIPAEEQPI